MSGRARFLDDDYGVKPADIHWIRGGIEEPGRPEKLTLNLPAGVRLDNAPEGATISALIESGEIDGFIAPRPPALTAPGRAHVGWLFSDPAAVTRDYFKRTGFFPIMHVGRRAPHARRAPSVASRCGAQGLRTGEAGGAQATRRHGRVAGHAAVPGRDAPATCAH